MNGKLKIAFALLLYSAPFYFFGCVDLPNKLVAPNWNVELSVPIVNRSYSLSDILRQQKYISVVPTSPSQNIYLLQSDNYSLDMGVADFIRVTSPTSLVNQQIPVLNNNNDSTFVKYLPIPDSAEIDSAKFIDGSFSFNFNNPNPFPVNLSLRIPAIRTPDGSVFVDYIQLAASTTFSKSYSFANDTYEITPSQIAAGKRDCVQLLVNANSSTIMESLISADFYSSNFLFSYIRGYLPTRPLGSESESFDLNTQDIQEYRDKITFKNVQLNLSGQYLSSVNDPFDIGINNLTITGTRNDGSTFSLTDKTGNKDFSFATQNGSFNEMFDSTNSNITDFLSFLPDKISISADYIMNPGNKYEIVTATNADSVKFSASFSTESYVAVNNVSITDTSLVEMNSDDRSKLGNGENFDLALEIHNGIPLSASVKVVFADSLFRPLFTLNDPQGNQNFSIDAAAVDQYGVMKSSTVSKKNMALNASQMSMLSKAYYAIYSVSIATPNSAADPPTIVAVRPDDQITIKATGMLNYNVNPGN